MPGRLACGNSDRIGNPVRRESEQFRAGGGSAEHAAGRGDVPATRIMAGRHRIADAAFDLHAENECGENGPPRKPARLRQCQHRRRDGRRRMNDRVQMGIVEIEQIGRNRVDERRAHRIEPLRAADDRRCRGAAERRQRAQRGGRPPGHSPNPARLQRSSGSSASLRDSCAATSAHVVPATKSAKIVPAPCASSCRTERIPRTLFFRPYSGAPAPVDRNLMLDRLTDNLEIWSTAAGNPGAARTRQEQRALAARQGANHGSRNNRLCRNGPHGRTDGRAPARRRLFAVHLRLAERGDQGAGRARRAACEIAGRSRFQRGYRAGQPADARHRQGGRAGARWNRCRKPRHAS